MGEATELKNNQGDGAVKEAAPTLSSRVVDLCYDSQLARKTANTASSLPGLALVGNETLPGPLDAANKLKSLSPDERLTYAKDLCKQSFTQNPRYQGAIETVEGKDGNQKEILVDFDSVYTRPDGRVDRTDLFNTTRGASGQADKLQEIYDVINPAVKTLEEMRSQFQKGRLIGSPEDEPLSSPTRVGGSEIGLAQGIQNQVDRELEAKGFSEDFRKDAKAALRENSLQHALEQAAIEREKNDIKDKPKKTNDDNKWLKDLDAYQKEIEAEHNAWLAKKEGLKLLK